MSDSPWSTAQSGPSSGSARSKPGRLMEIMTVVLLAVATVGSAWSAFQVSRWNGTETDEARASAGFRIEASREYALASQIVTYDSTTVSQYATAVSEDNETLQAFLRSTLVRPGFLPILESWEAQVSAGQTPTNLLADQAYLDDLFAASDAADAEAAAATVRSEEAGANADDYIQMTLFFASALFFAGITASFSNRIPRMFLLLSAGGVLVVAGVLLAGYPIA